MERTVVGITPVNLGRLFREGFSGFNPLGTLEVMAAQRTKEARGDELQVNELLPPSVVSLENSSHYDLYDKPEAVGPALEKLVPFFRVHLGNSTSA